MFYSEDLIEEIRIRNDIVDVINSYIKLQKRGNSHIGLCPFHNEKTPSFSVDQKKQMYHCFGCKVGGNVITFIMEYENYSFVEAIKYLADKAGITLPEETNSKESKIQADIKNTLLSIYKESAKYYFFQLKSERGTRAYKYLINRGITDEMIKKFGLGYSDNHLYAYIKQLDYKDDILKESGLFTMDEKGAYDKFWNRIIFPIMDINNKVIGFGGRVMGDGMPKYLNSPETRLFDKSRNLFGLNFARTSRKKNIIICEGYMDVISLYQAGFHNAVASLGTAFTGMQANLLKRYTEEVLLTYDSDGAGVKATLRAIPILKEAGLVTKVVSLEPFKDPDEFIKAEGVEAFKERMEQAINSFFFEIQVMEKEYDLTDPELKTRFYNSVAKKLLDFTEEIERNNYIEAVSQKYNIEFEQLRRLVNSYGARLGMTHEIKTYQSDNKKGMVREKGLKQSQKMLLTWLIEDDSLFDKIKDVINARDFGESIYYQAAQLLFDQYEKDKKFTPAKIINHFENKEEQTEVASLFNSFTLKEMSLSDREKALNETIYRIKKNSLDNEIKHADLNRLQEIIKEQRNLQKLHISLNDG